MDEHREKLCVGILTASLAAAGIPPLSNLIDVIYPNARDIYLITGKNAYDRFKNDKRVRICEFRESWSTEPRGHLAQQIFRYIKMQMQAARLLAKVGKRVDVWVFFIGADCLPLAGLAAKALGRILLVALSGSSCEISAATSSFPRVIAILQEANLRFSDRIILYADLAAEWNLEPYNKKVVIADRHFLNFDEFIFKNDLQERAPVVGYFGRLDAEKGVLNFVEALPKALETRPDLRALIIGEGNLEDEIRTLVDREPLRSKVTLKTWVPHAEIPLYLAKLKLLVLPSYTEGLPNVVLEAMACGTPVLATPVGAVPYVIEDKETGFLIRDNSPEGIAEGINESLSYPRLSETARNARTVVERDFRYERAVEAWARALSVQEGTLR
ncbi:MAG: glycosyltransferase family 4 protein [Halobacteriota archaeon]